MSRISIIEAPSNLGLKPPSPGKEPGVVRLPQALKQAGLYQRLQANLAGSIAPLPYSPQRDGKSHLLNPHAIHAFTVRLAESVGDVLEKGDFPLVLGGDCSILLGSLLALKKRGAMAYSSWMATSTFMPTPPTRQREEPQAWNWHW